MANFLRVSSVLPSDDLLPVGNAMLLGGGLIAVNYWNTVGIIFWFGATLVVLGSALMILAIDDRGADVGIIFCLTILFLLCFAQAKEIKSRSKASEQVVEQVESLIDGSESEKIKRGKSCI